MLRSSRIEASVNDVSVSDDGSHLAHRWNILEFLSSHVKRKEQHSPPGTLPFFFNFALGMVVWQNVRILLWICAEAKLISLIRVVSLRPNYFSDSSLINVFMLIVGFNLRILIGHIHSYQSIMYTIATLHNHSNLPQITSL